VIDDQSQNNIENLRAQLAESQIAGWLQVKNFDRPAASFDLKLNQLIVSEFQKLIAANVAASPDHPAMAEDHVSLIPQALAQTKPRASGPAFMPAGGRLSIERVALEKFVATEMQSQVALRDQVLDLNPLALNFCGGRYQGQLRIDLAESNPNLAVNGQFSGVDVNQFLSAASSQKNLVYGRASGMLNVRGRGRQLDPKSLTGPGRLLVTEGRITSFDLARQVEILGKLTGLPTSGVGTEFRSLSTDFRFDNGRLFTDNLRLEMSQMNVTGRGALQLGEPMTTDQDLVAQLSSALSKRVVPGGNFVSTAGNFFMDQGMLGVPLKMSGPITHPSFSLNAEYMGKRMTERFTRKPDQTVKDILDLFKGKDKPKP